MSEIIEPPNTIPDAPEAGGPPAQVEPEPSPLADAEAEEPAEPTAPEGPPAVVGPIDFEACLGSDSRLVLQFDWDDVFGRAPRSKRRRRPPAP